MSKTIYFLSGLVLGAVITSLVLTNHKSESVQHQIPAPEGDCTTGSFISEHCHDLVIDKRQYVTLKLELEDYLESKKQTGQLLDAGIFFRDLKDGPTMGLNEYANFIPASLFKLPTMVTFFALVESNPQILQQMVVYESRPELEELNREQIYPVDIHLVPGQSYVIEDLIKQMIIHSDNLALGILNDKLKVMSEEKGVELLVETYKELGLFPDKLDENLELSVKRYASIFRSLYYSSYLNRGLSEKALGILSEVKFKQGIVAGVPKDIMVAHKFGERGFTQDGKNLGQLHDCGIIYYPDNPYLLCIMTKGDDYRELETVISDVSRMFYEEVDSRRVNK